VSVRCASRLPTAASCRRAWTERANIRLARFPSKASAMVNPYHSMGENGGRPLPNHSGKSEVRAATMKSSTTAPASLETLGVS